MVSPGHDRQSASRVVIEPLTVEIVVIGVIDVELGLKRCRCRLIVELSSVVVPDITVGRREKSQEGVAVRLAAICTRVDRSQRQDGSNRDAGKRDSLGNRDYAVTTARVSHHASTTKVKLTSEDWISRVELLKVGDWCDG